jgi:hypothetical protein
MPKIMAEHHIVSCIRGNTKTRERTDGVLSPDLFITVVPYESQGVGIRRQLQAG